MATPTVALVLVSHSRGLAEGVAELARPMAPDVVLLPAGGTDDGRLGTSFDLIGAAVDEALRDGGSAVVLTDLGSAVLTAESVLEMADPAVVARVRLVDAPFVEGAVEAAVVAQAGADLDEVARAARDAGAGYASGRGSAPAAEETAGARPGNAGPPQESTLEGTAATGGATSHGHREVPEARGTAMLRNRLGLHARPAARLVRTASDFDATIAVDGADAKSVLALVALGAVGGQQLVVTASGPDASRAVRAVVAELEEGFGEA